MVTMSVEQSRNADNRSPSRVGLAKTIKGMVPESATSPIFPMRVVLPFTT